MSLIHKLADEATLRDLVASFCRAADHEASVDAVVALFTEDGVFELPDDKYMGRSAIANFLQSARKGGITGPSAGSRHLICNVMISAEGSSDEAEGWMEWLLVSPSSDPTSGERILASGRYEDRYQWTGGEWRISHRRVVI